MGDVAIRIEGLSKRYRIGVRERSHDTLGGALTDLAKRPFRNLRRLRELSTFDDSANREDVIWALDDVSFEVERGEIVGVIGRNGSGKSTIIKVLSRITSPTRGRVELSGRVGALLEVGTAFHPDLTGRENVYLNGSVLGMRKREIEARFDEIVGFSEVEKFIDMPVKRYSTGMALRLAFSVAAHLEAEILLVDEVLAVGDVKFQEKCVGKMQDVTTTMGRTVLFVSHNMGSVQRLCDRAVLLHDGELLMNGPTREVVSGYLGLGAERLGERVWNDVASAPGDDTARIRAVRMLDDRGELSSDFDVRDPVYVQMEYSVLRDVESLNVTFEFRNERGELVFVSTDDSGGTQPGRSRQAGLYRSTCRIPPDLLNNGQMFVLAKLADGVRTHAERPDVVTFNVLDSMDPDGARGSYPADWPATAVRPRLEWESERRAETHSKV